MIDYKSEIKKSVEMERGDGYNVNKKVIAHNIQQLQVSISSWNHYDHSPMLIISSFLYEHTDSYVWFVDCH